MQGSSGPKPRRFAAAVIALISIGAALPAAAGATYPGSTGSLAIYGGITAPFGSDSPGRSLRPGQQVKDPSWSPDGTRVVFVSRAAGNGNPDAIFVANADGSELQQVTSPVGSGELLSGPSWSPDGTQIAYVRLHEGGSDLRITTPAGGNGTAVLQRSAGGRFMGADWSPDPDNPQIAVELSFFDQEARGARSQLLLVSLSGSERVIAGPGPPYFPETHAARSMSWSPDGQKLAWAPRNANTVELYDASGAALGNLAPTGSQRVFGVAFTPDGGRILVGACTKGGSETTTTGTCTPVLMPLPDETLAFHPDEPAEQRLPGGYLADSFAPAFQPTDPPIIFIHGFLGSRMACGGRELWPALPPGSELTQLRLAEDGASNAPGTCGAQPTEILDTVLGSDIYRGALEKLEALAPGRVHPFAWDWRRDPRGQLAELNTLITKSLEDDLSKRQALDQVVLVGHSFGGILIRAALENPDMEKRIRRVLTIGAPYLGAPKAIFPLCCGIESPTFSGLDALIDNNKLREFSKNHTGNYFLYPSSGYGDWLGVDSGKLGQEKGVSDFVKRLGGSLTAYGRAVDAHQQLDGFQTLEPAGAREVRALVGTEVPTIGSVRIIRRGSHPARAGVAFETGDGTVPARSAAQGALTQDRDGVPLSYVCGVEHVPLPGDPKVVDLLGDFIRYGTPPKKTEPCPMKGGAYFVTDVDVVDSTIALAGRASAAAGAGPRTAGASGRSLAALRKAEQAGGVDVIEMPEETLVVAEGDAPAITLPADGLAVRAVQIGPQGAGKETRFPPMVGQLRLGLAANGSPAVTLDGKQPPAKALKLSVKLGKQGLAALRSRGARLTAACPAACRLSGKIVLSARDARRHKLVRGKSPAPVTIATGSGKLKRRGSSSLVLRLGRKAKPKLAHVKKLRVTLSVRATDGSGRVGAFSRTLTLR